MTGTSYGGYSAWWAITHFSPQTVAAAAPICGMTDLVVDYHATRPDLRPYSEEMMGGSPDEVPERYRERSPINYVQDIRGKLLIVHGSGDDNVHFQGTERLVNRLIELGKPFDFMMYPNRTHAIAEGPGTSAHIYQLIARYFVENLR